MKRTEARKQVQVSRVYVCIYRNSIIVREFGFNKFYEQMKNTFDLDKSHTTYFFRKHIQDVGPSVKVEIGGKKMYVQRIL